MKHCKKLLALVLVLGALFALSLTASAEKAQFSDANEITHTAAVDLLSAVGVINGYEDGSFNPTGKVTRAEMAKILAFVLNGGVDVGESYTSACTFADSQSHWAKGYIGYCVSAGLINGKNANTFDPNGQVTGYEVAKMLLCALGYKADLNGLVGANWNTTTHTLAIKSNLLTDLMDYAPAKPLNRDDSCQMILNAMKATMVESTGSVVEIDGITIVQDVQNTPIVQTGTDYADRADEDGDNTNGTQKFVQLIEDVFPSLKLATNNTHDPYGRPLVEWLYKGSTLCTSIMTPVATSNTTLKPSNVLKTLGDVDIKSAEVFVNGTHSGPVTVDQLLEVTGLSMSQILTQPYKVTAGAIGKGCGTGRTESKNGGPENFPTSVLAQMLVGYTGNFRYSSSSSGNSTGSSRATYTFYTEAYFDATTGKFTLINNNFYYGRVNAVRNEVVDANGNVITPAHILVTPINGDGSYSVPTLYANLEVDDNIIISGGNVAPILMEDVTISEDQAGIKVGDFVLFTVGIVDRNASPKQYCAENAILMDRVTVTPTKVAIGVDDDGELEEYDTVYDESGTRYRPAAKTGSRTSHKVGPTYDLIVAKLGSRYYYFRTEEVASNYMYLYRTERNNDSLSGGYIAKLVDSEGNIKIVNTDQLYHDIVGSIVVANENSLGQTVLKAVGNYSDNHNVQVKVENSNATVAFDGVTKTADANTRFIISQIDTNAQETFTVYTGIHNVPSIQSGQYYAYLPRENGILDTVYILNATGISSSSQEGVVFKTSAKDALRTDGKGTYYELPAFIGGQLTTANVSTSAYATLMGDGFHLFRATTTDSYGVITAFTKIAPTAITQFTPANAGNIFLNNTPMTYHDNVLVYTYSVATETLAASTVEELPELVYNAGFNSYYTLHENYTGQPLAAIFAIIP